MSAMSPSPKNSRNGNGHGPLDDSSIRELERQLAVEREKTCSDADEAIRTSRKILDRPKKESRKFKVATTQTHRKK